MDKSKQTEINNSANQTDTGTWILLVNGHTTQILYLEKMFLTNAGYNDENSHSLPGRDLNRICFKTLLIFFTKCWKNVKHLALEINYRLS